MSSFARSQQPDHSCHKSIRRRVFGERGWPRRGQRSQKSPPMTSPDTDIETTFPSRRAGCPTTLHAGGDILFRVSACFEATTTHTTLLGMGHSDAPSGASSPPPEAAYPV